MTFLEKSESLHTQCAAKMYLMRTNLQLYRETAVQKYKEEYFRLKAEYLELMRQLMLPVIDNMLVKDFATTKKISNPIPSFSSLLTR